MLSCSLTLLRLTLSPDSGLFQFWTLHTAITSEQIAVVLLAWNVPRRLNCLLDRFFLYLPLPVIDWGMPSNIYAYTTQTVRLI